MWLYGLHFAAKQAVIARFHTWLWEKGKKYHLDIIDTNEYKTDGRNKVLRQRLIKF